VEFGRLLQAWLALENGARFAVRYAVTGEFNLAYCDDADAALGLTTEDANADCKVETAETATDAEKEEARDQTQALQDWARMPSIQDAALGGASGIAYDEAVSGDYKQYLTNSGSHGSTFSADDRGDPSKPGYFAISTCSSRHVPAASGSLVSPENQRFFISYSSENPQYYPGHTGQDEYLYFPSVCRLYEPIAEYMDDAGGPGDRVRVTLTYRHNMIMPLLSQWWPTLRLNTSRDGTVEKFRTSRVTGLSEGNMSPNTATPLPPTPTFTPDTPTLTPVPDTPTYTPTLPCPSDGNGIRAEYYSILGYSFPPANPFTNPIRMSIVPNVNYNWGSGTPVPGVGADYFAAIYVGEVMPMYSEQYTFYSTTDDGGRVWVGGNLLVNRWVNQGATENSGTINLTRCEKYTIRMEYFENTGSAVAELRWSSASQAKEIIPQIRLYAVNGTISTATITPTSTVTLTRTITQTRTITNTPTRTGTRTQTLIPSMTYTVTLTLIPSSTSTITNTRTPTSTHTLTNTPTVTNTRTITSTLTITPNVPTKTSTITKTREGGG
jgi:hypothetical protein